MESIAMFNNKGGVGKTTLLCNLAAYLCKARQKRCLLLMLIHNVTVRHMHLMKTNFMMCTMNQKDLRLRILCHRLRTAQGI